MTPARRRTGGRAGTLRHLDRSPRRGAPHGQPVRGPLADERKHHEAGSGMISTTSGFAVFLIFLLFAAHLTLRLHAATLVTSAATEGARTVADAGVDRRDPVALAAARRDGEQRTRTLLGRAGHQATLDWSGSTAERVVLRVRLDVPDVLPDAFSMSLTNDVVDRTVTVRAEEPR